LQTSKVAAPNGHGEGSALDGSHGLGGRSPPEPSERIKPTPELLKSKLVLTGLMGVLQDMPEEDEP
jgi:hypothetical protein